MGKRDKRGGHFVLRIATAVVAFLACGTVSMAADCANPANQAEITECANDAASKADTALNDAYGQLMNLLGSSEQTMLIDSQKAWIVFRDAECAFRTKSYSDGSIYSSLLANCIAELSTERATQLTAQINCGEGDLCAPHVAGAEPQPAANDTRSCKVTAGLKRADLYVSHCTQVTEASNAACNVESTCGAMIDEIKRGCATIGSGAPAFCATYIAGKGD
jgi:uncharacterized protein YecT (DUF1311 family)